MTLHVPATGEAIRSDYGLTNGAGPTVPAADVKGWQHGAIWNKALGTTALDGIYVNIGSADSANFVSLSTIVAAVLGTAGTVEAAKGVVVDVNKDIAGFRNLSATGSLRGPGQRVTAAGSNQSDAAQLVEGINYVVGANGTKGVRLPAGTIVAGVGQLVVVVNAVASNLPVYPASGEAIESNASDDPQTVAGSKRAIFVSPGGDGVGGAGGWFELLGA